MGSKEIFNKKLDDKIISPAMRWTHTFAGKKQDMNQFKAFFGRADLDGDGRISEAEAINFFQGSNLPQQVIAKIWTLADEAKTGFLGQNEFFNALKLVTVAQHKLGLTTKIVKAVLSGQDTVKIPAPQINPPLLSSLSPISEIEGHTTRVPSDEEIDIDLKSLSLKEVDELYNRPKNGAIYDEVSANWKTITERLEFLSNKNENLSIDEAIEIYDASILLKLMRKHDDDLEKAGKMAHSGVLLILQGKTLGKKGRQLLDMSKTKLQEM